MGITKAFTSAIGGTFADLWKDAYTAGHFDELTVVSPGVQAGANRGHGSNPSVSGSVITNGSKIFVPEHTAAFVFSQGAIETVMTTPGKYEYQSGTGSIFNGDGIGTIIDQVGERLAYGGTLPDQKQIAYVNMREIRGIRFGTAGPQMYHDRFYGSDLEVMAYGTFSVLVTDPDTFVRSFLPPNTNYYSFADKNARAQIVPEFTQSLMSAINALSEQYRATQLPAKAAEIAAQIQGDTGNAGTWPQRFGFRCEKVAISSIEFSEESRAFVSQFAQNRMSMGAFEGISQNASSVVSQRLMAEGVRDHGFGDGGGMLLGLGVAQGFSSQGVASRMDNQQGYSMQDESYRQNGQGNSIGVIEETASSSQPALPSMSLDEQIAMVMKMKELLDAGILTQEEFETKKKQIMNL